MNIDQKTKEKFEQLKYYIQEGDIDISDIQLLSIAEAIVTPKKTMGPEKVIDDFWQYLGILCFLSDKKFTDNVPECVEKYNQTLYAMLEEVEKNLSANKSTTFS